MNHDAWFQSCGTAICGDRARCDQTTATMTASAERTVEMRDVLSEQERRPEERQERLQLLHLAAASDSGKRETAIPGKEAEVHR